MLFRLSIDNSRWQIHANCMISIHPTFDNHMTSFVFLATQLLTARTTLTILHMGINRVVLPKKVDALWGALCFVAVCAWRLTLATESTSEALTVDEGDEDVMSKRFSHTSSRWEKNPAVHRMIWMITWTMLMVK